MPLKLNVGLSKKVGLPDHSSIGASCHVELELNNGLLDGGPSGFQAEAQRAFAACRQAVDDELARQNTNNADEEPKEILAPKNGNGSPPTGSPTIGPPASSSATSSSSPARSATWEPGGWKGCQRRCSTSPWPNCRASTPARSSTLKQVKAGKVDLDATGKGAAA